jgi:Zn-finger nucleic acid-binding protein
MAISPLTNIIYINQNMNVAASVQNMEFNRFDIQQMAAQALTNEKEKIVEETRPPEETHAIDPDREHERKEAEAREEERHKKHETPSEQPTSEKGIHTDEEGHLHIDIHV